MLDVFYSISSLCLLLSFIIVLLVISLTSLCLFIYLFGSSDSLDVPNTSIESYISLLSIVVGIIIAFIIVEEWNRYIEAKNKASKEATVLLDLYRTVDVLPSFNRFILDAILEYVRSIIRIEYPLMKEGKVPSDINNSDLRALVDALYMYNPNPDIPRDTILYSKAVDLLSEAMELRSARIESSTNGIKGELWAVVLIGYTLLMIASFIIKGTLQFKLVMTSLVTIGYATLLFIIVAIDYPFRGEYSISPEPFSRTERSIVS